MNYGEKTALVHRSDSRFTPQLPKKVVGLPRNYSRFTPQLPKKVVGLPRRWALDSRFTPQLPVGLPRRSKKFISLINKLVACFYLLLSYPFLYILLREIECIHLYIYNKSLVKMTNTIIQFSLIQKRPCNIIRC
jgi:hypothetical protein